MEKTKLILVIILVINILLRIPSLFDPVSYGDECIYLTLGNAFNKGLVFYRDIHDNKPPLLYLVAALAGSKLFWFRLITIIWSTINIFLIYKLTKKILKKEQAAIIGSAIFTIFSLLPEGRIANGEIFMIMPATLGLLLAWTALKSTSSLKKKQNLLWILSGLCFSLAFLFKIPIVFDFIGFLLAFFVFILPKKAFNKKRLKNTLLVFLKDKRLYLILIGFFAPIFLSIIYYAQKGAFTPYVRSALLQNIGYLSSWGKTNWGLFQRAGILLIISLLIFHWRQKLGFAFYLPALMAFFGLYGVFLSERPYPHYLIEIAPWAALSLAVLLWQKKPRQLIICLLLIFLTLWGVNEYKFWWYPNIPYYQNFLKFSFGKITKQEFFSFFGEKTINDYQIAKYLKTRSQPNERVFIWGDGACIYALAERMPPGRYTVNYHIYDFNGYSETIRAIEEKNPKIIIVLEPAKEKFPQLESLLTNSYIQTKEIGKAKIYHHLLNNLSGNDQDEKN